MSWILDQELYRTNLISQLWDPGISMVLSIGTLVSQLFPDLPVSTLQVDKAYRSA